MRINKQWRWAWAKRRYGVEMFAGLDFSVFSVGVEMIFRAGWFLGVMLGPIAVSVKSRRLDNHMIV